MDLDEQGPHLTLFDTGPDSQALVRNVHAMQTPIDRIERVITSHWHSDHTGGLLSFLNLRRSKTDSTCPPCVIDLHPDRPLSRGIAPGPGYDKVICALPPDPTFKLIEEAGGIVDKHPEGHTVAGDTVWVSGEIPRVTEYEAGILGGMRWVSDSAETTSVNHSGKWVKENVGDGLLFLIGSVPKVTDAFECSILWTRDTLLSTLQGKVWLFSARMVHLLRRKSLQTNIWILHLDIFQLFSCRHSQCC